MQPALFVDGLGRVLGHVVVALHHVVATATHLAHGITGDFLVGFRIADGDFDAGHTPPHGLDPTLHGVVGAGLGHDRRTFGQAVADGDFAHAHLIHDPAHERLGAHGPCHDPRTQRGKIETREDAVIQNGLEHGRHAVQGGALLLLHGGHHLHGGEGVEQHHGGPVVHAGHDPEHAAEAVEQRHGQAYPVARGKFLMVADPIAVVDDVHVRQHHALGEARRPGRVLHVHHVIGRNGRLAAFVFLIRDISGEGKEFRQGIHAPVLVRTKEKHALQVRQPLDFEHPAPLAAQFGEHLIRGSNKIVVAHAVDDEEVLAFRLLQQVTQFRFAVIGVYRDQNGPDAGRGEHEGHPMRHVGRPYGNLLALLYADGHQASGHIVHTRRKLGPRLPQLAVRVDHGVGIGKTGRRILQKLAQRQFLHCKIAHVRTPKKQIGRHEKQTGIIPNEVPGPQGFRHESFGGCRASHGRLW